jgi:hypothetical protein
MRSQPDPGRLGSADTGEPQRIEGAGERALLKPVEALCVPGFPVL